MRNFFKKTKAKLIGTIAAVKAWAQGVVDKARERVRARAIQAAVFLAASRGENFVDSGIKILIAVVIGALLLGGLYALFGDTIMPTVTQKVKDMFNFKG